MFAGSVACQSCCASSCNRVETGRINVSENAKSFVNKLLPAFSTQSRIRTYGVYVLPHARMHTLSGKCESARCLSCPLLTRLHLKMRCSSHFLSIFASVSTHCDQSASVTCHTVWLECHFLSGDIWVIAEGNNNNNNNNITGIAFVSLPCGVFRAVVAFLRIEPITREGRSQCRVISWRSQRMHF